MPARPTASNIRRAPADDLVSFCPDLPVHKKGIPELFVGHEHAHVERITPPRPHHSWRRGPRSLPPQATPQTVSPATPSRPPRLTSCPSWPSCSSWRGGIPAWPTWPTRSFSRPCPCLLSCLVFPSFTFPSQASFRFPLGFLRFPLGFLRFPFGFVSVSFRFPFGFLSFRFPLGVH